MNYRWTKRTEDLPEERTAVWTCTNEACNGWMRDGFTFEDVPSCPQCKSPMAAGSRMLPALSSSADDLKRRGKQKPDEKASS